MSGRTTQRRALTVAVAALALSLAGFAGTALAVTHVTTVTSPAGAAKVTISGDPERSNLRIRVRSSGIGGYDLVVIRDDQHGVTGCDQVTAVLAECHQVGPIEAVLGGGDDRMRVQEAPVAAAGGRGNDTLSGGREDDALSGQAGLDRLRGGNGDDRLGGGSGTDKLRGGRGKDHLRGDSKPDQFFGGRGNDRLRAIDGSADAVIDCGPGTDRAFIDRSDPSPLHCERISYSPPPRP